MSLTAVKFGRMSKKQRERVEDEANFHKRRLTEMTGSVHYDDMDKPLSPTNNNIASSADTGNHVNRYTVFML